MKGKRIKNIICEYLRKKNMDFDCPHGENPDIVLPDKKEWIEAKGENDIKTRSNIEKCLTQLEKYMLTRSETKFGIAFPLNTSEILFLSTMLYILEDACRKRGYTKDNEPQIRIYLVKGENNKFKVRKFNSAANFNNKIIISLQNKLYIPSNISNKEAIKKVKKIINNLGEEIEEILVAKPYSYDLDWEEVEFSSGVK